MQSLQRGVVHDVAGAREGARAKKKLKQQQICCILRGNALQVRQAPGHSSHDCGKLTQYLEATHRVKMRERGR